MVGFITVTIIFGCPKNCNAGTPANLLFTSSTELPDLACFVGCFITVFTGSLFAIVNSLSNCYHIHNLGGERRLKDKYEPQLNYILAA